MTLNPPPHRLRQSAKPATALRRVPHIPLDTRDPTLQIIPANIFASPERRVSATDHPFCEYGLPPFACKICERPTRGAGMDTCLVGSVLEPRGAEVASMSAAERAERLRQAEANAAFQIGDKRVGAAQAARRVFEWEPLPQSPVVRRELNDAVTAHALGAVGRAFGSALLPLILWGETLRDHQLGRSRAGRTQRVVEVFVPFELIVGRDHLDLVLVCVVGNAAAGSTDAS